MRLIDSFFAILKSSQKKVLLKKVIARISPFEFFHRRSAADWYNKSASDLESTAGSFDRGLWEEACIFVNTLDQESKKKLISLKFKTGGGGGGSCKLLFYLTRRFQPSTVVETGVAAGYSSQTILSAFQRNGHGNLFSSEFPYPLLSYARSYVGILVDRALKDHWKLYMDADANNLPVICSELSGKIELLHYDSDKSYTGRTFAMNLLEPYLSPDCIIIFDDIDDNSHFRDWVVKNGYHYRILRIGKKFVGITTRKSPLFLQIFQNEVESTQDRLNLETREL